MFTCLHIYMFTYIDTSICICIKIYLGIDISLSIYTYIYYKELAHIFTEADDFQDLQLASWRPMKVDGVIPV